MPSTFISGSRKKLASLGGAPNAHNLNFLMQVQEQTNWCWSAVAVSTSHHYDAASNWIQCEVVNEELGQTTCCQNGSSALCNVPWYLDRALTRTGNLDTVASGRITFANLRQRIDASRAIGVRIGWNGGGGHFVILDGYNSNGTFVSVRDLWYGDSTITYNAIATAYQGNGSWTHTFITKP